jgi:hypothetical protein
LTTQTFDLGVVFLIGVTIGKRPFAQPAPTCLAGVRLGTRGQRAL